MKEGIAIRRLCVGYSDVTDADPSPVRRMINAQSEMAAYVDHEVSNPFEGDFFLTFYYAEGLGVIPTVEQIRASGDSRSLNEIDRESFERIDNEFDSMLKYAFAWIMGLFVLMIIVVKILE